MSAPELNYRELRALLVALDESVGTDVSRDEHRGVSPELRSAYVKLTKQALRLEPPTPGATDVGGGYHSTNCLCPRCCR